MELREVFEPIVNFLKNLQKKDKDSASKEKAKERLQLVLLQDRASVSPDFFEMMKKEIIEVIKKYIEIDEESLEVQLTRGFEDGDETGPALYANIPIKNIKPVAKKVEENDDEELVTEIVNHENIAENSNLYNNMSATEEVAEEIIQEVEKKVEEVLVAASDEIVEDVNKIEYITENDTNVDVEKNVENIDQVDSENNVENIDQVDSENNIEIIESANCEIDEIVDEKKNQDDSIDNMKEKINEVKEGVVETLEKVKNGAKESIKKIKSKTQKKKINE